MTSERIVQNPNEARVLSSVHYQGLLFILSSSGPEELEQRIDSTGNQTVPTPAVEAKDQSDKVAYAQMSQLVPSECSLLAGGQPPSNTHQTVKQMETSVQLAVFRLLPLQRLRISAYFKNV